jgi:hypothetical protein
MSLFLIVLVAMAVPVGVVLYGIYVLAKPRKMTRKWRRNPKRHYHGG